MDVWRCQSLSNHVVEVASRTRPTMKHYVWTGDERLSPSCSCEAWRFRKKYDYRCEHIRQAQAELCGWHQGLDGGEPAWKHRSDLAPHGEHDVEGPLIHLGHEHVAGELVRACPRCGGEVVVIPKDPSRGEERADVEGRLILGDDE